VRSDLTHVAKLKIMSMQLCQI